jgi:hypothetical protein
VAFLAEPTTALTDYALALLCVGLARVPWSGSPPARLWAGGLLGAAVAAAVGGTVHGFAPVLPPLAMAVLWAITYAAIGVSNLGFLAGAARYALPSRFLATAYVVLAVRLGIYGALIARDPSFRWVVMDFVVTLALLAAFAAWGARRGEPWWSAVAGGVALSFAGAGIQASGVDLHPLFNHNDAFHVVQMAAMVFLQRGAVRLAGGRPPGG